MSEGLDLQDFLGQIKQMRRMGPLQQIMEMLPRGFLDAFGGGGSMDEMDPREIDRIEAIIFSMTPQERRSPKILNISRKRRIARGSGTSVADVNSLLKQFDQTQTMVRHMVAGPKDPRARAQQPGVRGATKKQRKKQVRKKKRSRR